MFQLGRLLLFVRLLIGKFHRSMNHLIMRLQPGRMTTKQQLLLVFSGCIAGCRKEIIWLCDHIGSGSCIDIISAEKDLDELEGWDMIVTVMFLRILYLSICHNNINNTFLNKIHFCSNRTLFDYNITWKREDVSELQIKKACTNVLTRLKHFIFKLSNNIRNEVGVCVSKKRH